MNTVETNYSSLTDEDVKRFLVDHIAEFGEYEITMSELDHSSIAIERWQHGFAIVLNPDTCDVQLWWLYVDPVWRGKKLGRAYMKDVLKKYGHFWRMQLTCNVKLRAFYSSFGFRVIEKEGDKRLMQMKED